ncbi:MAG: Ldh family oxidoreductase [Candidatus Aenigmarchaeota archaeon]|nr:Ldh family oxidoreductase [Candidatus Aenigmarchaeota archaeon]
MKIKVTDLMELAKKILKLQGYSEEEAQTISDVLMYAQLRGNNQGLVKLIGKGMPKNPKAGEIKIVKETRISALLDGNKNQGMVVMKKALEVALSKAKENGFAIVGTNNTSTSTGAIGYYARQIAEQGYIGFVFAGSPETVNAHGSYQPIFGTNPLAIGMPSAKDPVVLDMATASMAYYGLIEAKTAGRNIPHGMAYDSSGNITTDPAKAMEGAIMPFDRGYKSSGLSLMVEILTGPLVQASFTGIGDTKGNWGNLIFIIDPELLTDRDDLRNQVSQLVEKVKATKKLPTTDEILVPGERGGKLASERKRRNEIEIEDNLYREIIVASGGQP